MLPGKALSRHGSQRTKSPILCGRLDQNLRYTPVFELRDPDRRRSVRIGPHVLSYHQLAPYSGWAEFKPELLRATEGLCPPSTSVVIDVDVFTKDSFRTRDRQALTNWIELAHTQEKEHFFRLLTDATIDALKES